MSEAMRQNGFDTTHATDGEQALEALRQRDFDLCIFDIMLPKVDGFELAEQARQLRPKLAFMFVTARGRLEDKLKGFRTGADDYLTKPFSMEELLLRVQAILKRVQGEEEEKPTDYTLGAFVFDPRHRTLTHNSNGSEQKLSAKEGGLLMLLCEYRNKLLPRSVALEQVWGRDDYYTARSMDVYVSKLRKYLRDEPRVEIQNEHGSGFRLIVD